MNYYLTPYVGTGTTRDPFRPRGADQAGWTAIDMRPDARVAAGFAVLALPVRDDAGTRTYLGDDLGARSLAVTTAINTRLGVTLAGATLRECLPELLLTHARTDGTRWRPLSPSAGGVYEVWLGERVARLPIVQGGAYFNETWTHADNALLTADLTWTDLQGTNWRIVSNAAEHSIADVTFEHVSRADVDTTTVNQIVRATILGITAPNPSFIQPGIIGRKANNATMTYYSTFSTWTNGTAGGNALHKAVAGVATDLGSNATVMTVGAEVSLAINGSAISARINGVTDIGPVTDTAIAANTRGGIRGYMDTAGGVIRLDNWHIQDISIIPQMMHCEAA